VLTSTTWMPYAHQALAARRRTRMSDRSSYYLWSPLCRRVVDSESTHTGCDRVATGLSRGVSPESVCRFCRCLCLRSLTRRQRNQGSIETGVAGLGWRGAACKQGCRQVKSKVPKCRARDRRDRAVTLVDCAHMLVEIGGMSRTACKLDK
jgi:hypothetical protein